MIDCSGPKYVVSSFSMVNVLPHEANVLPHDDRVSENLTTNSLMITLGRTPKALPFHYTFSH